MAMENNQAEQPDPPRRQFRLATMFVIVTVCAVFFALLNYRGILGGVVFAAGCLVWVAVVASWKGRSKTALGCFVSVIVLLAMFLPVVPPTEIVTYQWYKCARCGLPRFVSHAVPNSSAIGAPNVGESEAAILRMERGEEESQHVWYRSDGGRTGYVSLFGFRWRVGPRMTWSGDYRGPILHEEELRTLEALYENDPHVCRPFATDASP